MIRAILHDPAQIQQILDCAKSEPVVGFDIETAGMHPDSALAGFSIHLPTTQESYYIPINHPGCSMPQDVLGSIAASVSLLKVATYNGQTDTGKWLMLFGSTPTIVGDALILNKMLQGATTHTFGLKPLALELGTAMQVIDISQVLGEGNYDFTTAALDHPLLLAYTTQDAEQAVLTEQGLRTRDLDLGKFPDFESVYRLELDILPFLGREQLRGIPLDMEKFELAARRMQMEADDLEAEICQELNRDTLVFNPDSDQSLSAALFNKPDKVVEPLPPMKPRQRKPPVRDQRDLPGLGLTPGTSGVPKGPKDNPNKYTYYSTATIELQRIENQHPVITKILEWKHLTSISRDVKNVDKFCKDGRLYTNFLTVGDDGTSRIYTEKPNLIGFSKTVRSAMPPDPYRIYVHVDFQAAEWRLAALLAGETKILEALDAGHDPHKTTFSIMSGTPMDQVTKEQRGTGKILNYAALFGSTGYSIARSLKCSEGEARDQQQKFWTAFPNLAKWRDLRYEYAEKHFRTYTVIGRIRTLQGMRESRAAREQGKRRSVNTATQGSCGDCLKLAIRDFYKQSENPQTFLGRYQGRIVCPVYDAVLVQLDYPLEMDREVWKKQAEAALREVLEVKLEYQGRTTKMKVDMGFSSESWLLAMDK